jgi:hypothetical protein
VDAVACRETPWASDEANGVGHGIKRAERARFRCRVGWWSACGWVRHASTVRPDPSTRGVVGERDSHRESCLQLVPGSAGQALGLLQARVVAVIAERLAVALAVMPQVCAPSHGQGRRRRAEAGSYTALTCCYVVVELRGFEPLTSCMPYTDQQPHHGRYGR